MLRSIVCYVSCSSLTYIYPKYPHTLPFIDSTPTLHPQDFARREQDARKKLQGLGIDPDAAPMIPLAATQGCPPSGDKAGDRSEWHEVSPFMRDGVPSLSLASSAQTNATAAVTAAKTFSVAGGDQARDLASINTVSRSTAERSAKRAAAKSRAKGASDSELSPRVICDYCAEHGHAESDCPHKDLVSDTGSGSDADGGYFNEADEELEY